MADMRKRVLKDAGPVTNGQFWLLLIIAGVGIWATIDLLEREG